jgi:hypothetical protein
MWVKECKNLSSKHDALPMQIKVNFFHFEENMLVAFIAYIYKFISSSGAATAAG